MPNTKLSVKASTNTTSGSYCYIIIPDGLGGWISHKITVANLIKTATDAISILSTQLGGFGFTKYENRDTGFTITMPANSYLDRIFIRKISGTPVVKIGTTVGGIEIMDEIVIQTGVNVLSLVQQLFHNETIIYITISGGIINMKVNTILDIL